MTNVPIHIITCPMWHARPPKAPPTLIGRSHSVIFHHTDSHHREISNPRDESVAEAIRYAQDIQRFHMDVRGWNDSGHNFLVTRAGGHILQGRWYSVTAITHGHMVRSAHCAQAGKPGSDQNTEIGIEHEHLPGEEITEAQVHSSAQLQAWIASKYGLSMPLVVFPHSRFCDTKCPDNLAGSIQRIRGLAAQILRGNV